MRAGPLFAAGEVWRWNLIEGWESVLRIKSSGFGERHQSCWYRGCDHD